MEIFYARRAEKQFEKLPRATQKRIAEKMRFYAAQENPLKFAERLTDYREGEFRFRMGEYRASFDVKKSAIYVLKIAKRDKMYD